MSINEGTIDRVVRVTVGLVLIGLTLTGAIGWCPVYSLIGTRTCKSNH